MICFNNFKQALYTRYSLDKKRLLTDVVTNTPATPLNDAHPGGYLLSDAKLDRRKMAIYNQSAKITAVIQCPLERI
jgi:hypothetical protein